MASLLNTRFGFLGLTLSMVWPSVVFAQAPTAAPREAEPPETSPSAPSAAQPEPPKEDPEAAAVPPKAAGPEAGEAAAGEATPGAPPTEGDTSETAATGAESGQQVGTVFPPPVDRPPVPKRGKPQATTVGMTLGAVDFGAEADIVSSVGKIKAPPDNRRWTYALRGFFRAPMRIGIGPETGSTSGSQFHSPPRTVGLNADEWNYINVAPGATGQLELAVTNQRVEGHVIIAGDVFWDAGYPHLDKMGGFSQAWVTLKSPALVGTRGGLALNAGAFSERFGAAGPYQQSTGYYGTYLFGRTHVAGETLVLDVDASDDVQIIAEHGFGAKVEVVPYRKFNPPVLPYLPNQGLAPQGSNFLHHAHLSLIYQDWLTLAGHYLTSWSPNDLAETTAEPAREARMTIFGGEVHTDHPVFGNGYLGYSYLDAQRILPLSDAVQVLHGSVGWVFKENYFGKLSGDAQLMVEQNQETPTRDDSGKLQSLLFQYIVRAAPLLGRTEPGPDLALAVFGMINHVDAPKQDLNGMPVVEYQFTQDKIKFGTELQVAPIEPLSVGLRFDRVMPDGGGNPDAAYSAISPRVVLHSKWIGREYVILNYTRFFNGKDVRPSPPYSQPRLLEEPLASITKPDENLVSLTAMVAF